MIGGLLVGRLGMSRIVWLSVLALGVIIIAYSRMTLFAPAAALLFVSGLPNGTVNTVMSPMLLGITPREMVGRVSSLLYPVIMIASIVGTAMADYLDAVVLRGFSTTVLGMRFGPVDIIFLSSEVIVLLSALLAVARLRDPQPALVVETAATPAEREVHVMV
jgi:hypothetical protein